MGTSKKQYLTGTVHRLNDGVLESHFAGDEAPDWVTNTKVLTDKAPGTPDAEPTEPTPPPAGDGGKGNEQTTDDLDGLNSKALQVIAGELGLKKNGSKPDLTARIRAKRAEMASATPSEEDTARAALIESLKAQGQEVAEDATDAELQALAESLEEQE
jgi:hypothetical protein